VNHNNYYFLQHLTVQLQQLLQGALFVEGYSTSKQELWLVFKKADGNYFQFKFNFIQTDSILSFPADAPLHKHKQPQFRQLEALQVVAVQQHAYERSFHIELANGYYLYIKLFGKNGNVLLLKGGEVIEVFRRHIKADATVDFEQITAPKNIDVADALLTATPKEISKTLPFFPADALEELVNKGFFESPETKKLEQIKTVFSTIEKGEFFICKVNDEYQLRFFSAGEELGQYSTPVEAQNDFARLYLGKYFFDDKKHRIVQGLKQRKEKLEKEVQSKKLKLQKIATQTPYNHIGDILMAHLHLLKKGEETAKLLNFYTNADIDIKLKKELSPQENAENYYRKAKNQTKEIQILEENLQKAETELDEVAQKLDAALLAESGKDLRGMEKEKQAVEESSKPSLFKEFEKSGYTILVGKNSENNDVLTQKHANKNDIWLHARGMAGSHVVIRSKAGQTLPVDVLEYAASLAAYFSKGRTDSLCPVIYTEKKYVRKPKGAAPGKVVVEKEKTLLVKPAFVE
jgi:predicted ribosome quality control (RQC) complex YloA/Tae2 family protein